MGVDAIPVHPRGHFSTRISRRRSVTEIARSLRHEFPNNPVERAQWLPQSSQLCRVQKDFAAREGQHALQDKVGGPHQEQRGALPAGPYVPAAHPLTVRSLALVQPMIVLVEMPGASKTCCRLVATAVAYRARWSRSGSKGKHFARFMQNFARF